LTRAPKQLLVVHPEVPGVKKKGDPSSRLVADTGLLTLVARNSEHQRRACTPRRGDDNPPLVGRERSVFKNFEAENVAEKGEPIVIAGNKNRYGSETLNHGWTLPAHMV
jgi:hypothetical protein